MGYSVSITLIFLVISLLWSANTSIYPCMQGTYVQHSSASTPEVIIIWNWAIFTTSELFLTVCWMELQSHRFWLYNFSLFIFKLTVWWLSYSSFFLTKLIFISENLCSVLETYISKGWNQEIQQGKNSNISPEGFW